MIHMRSYTLFEEANIAFLVNKNIDFTQVQITETGLKKSIMDATAPMRLFFVKNGIHNFENQKQGPENKVMVDTCILTESEAIETQTSFYRPVTKNGDPRLWIYRIQKVIQPNDICVILKNQDSIGVINITKCNIRSSYESIYNNPIKEFISSIYASTIVIANELLCKFRRFSGQWFESEVQADTGIGRTIETMLGIDMNSSDLPDYKGIELKSMRAKRTSVRSALFTQTPNWEMSRLKSGKEIVEKYGYYDCNGHKTYQNTVKCAKPNSQSLVLFVDEFESNLELLKQVVNGKNIVTNEDVAIWTMEKLHQRLLTKHHETFWIEVQNEVHDGKEYFKYSKIEHTKNPNVSQFDILLQQSIITLDLLLCRPSGRGDTYSFKITKKGIPLLFPQSEIYQL